MTNPLSPPSGSPRWLSQAPPAESNFLAANPLSPPSGSPRWLFQAPPAESNFLAAGSFTYTPANNYFGNDSFTYHAYNGFLNSAIVTVSITINEVVPPPVAVADSYSTSESTALVIALGGLLANDRDPRSRPLAAVLDAGPSRGTLALNANGNFTYTPNMGYFGSDAFTYHANNGILNSGIVTVVITINEVVPPPVADGDSFSTNESMTLVISATGVLANDSDPRSRPLTAVLNAGPSHGTLALNASGSFTYTPANNYFGNDSFTYHAYNGFLNSAVVTVVITITEVIPPPVALGDSYSTNESTALVIPAGGVLANDSDPRSRPLTAILDAGPNHGTITLNINGGFIYTPDAGYFGNDSFIYHSRNGFLNSGIVTVAVTVNEVVPPPVAVGDSFSTNESAALVIPGVGVLANDSDPRTRPITAVLDVGPSHGTLSLNANGSFTYTPTDNYFGNDSFTYHANNGFLNSAIVTVAITITEVIPPPVALGDSYSTNESTALVIPAGGVLANDSDPRSRPLTAILDATPSHGTITLNTNGGFIYTPDVGYFGTESFTYHARNGILNSAIVTVAITVKEVVPAPVASDNFYSTNYGTALVIPAAGVLTNDFDPRSRPLTAIISTGPVNGTLTLNPNGSFTYTPAASYTGTDSFTYRANNGAVNSNLATVRISVNALVLTGLVNGSFEAGFAGWTYTGNQHIQSTAPYVPTNGNKLVGYNGADLTPNAVMSQSFLTMPGQTYTLAFDLGVLSFNTSSQTMQVTVDGTGNLLTRTITINGLGGGTSRWLPQSFTFVANSTSATLTFRDQSLSTLNIDMILDNARVTGPPVVTNTAPAAAADSYSTYQDTPLLIPPSGVLANDTDAQSQALTAYLNTVPAHGTVMLETTGGFIYTPYQGFSGNDSFTYAANDGALGSNIATVNLTVAGINTAPIAMTDSYATSENTLLVVSAAGVLANDTDAQSQTLSAFLDVGPGHGTLSLNLNGSFIYTPAAGYFGSDSFTYHANDGSLNSNVITVGIAINEVVPPPVAFGDSYSTNEFTRLVIPAAGVLTNDSDPRSRPLTAILDASPSHGMLTLNSNGSFTYTPNAGYFGNDSFTYHARNGFLSSNIVTVNITINEVIPPPVAVGNSYSVNKDSLLSIPASGLLSNDSDPRARPLTAVLNSGPAHGTLTLSANGAFTYTPAAGYFGGDSFTYHTSNGFKDSNVATVSLMIDEVVPPPIASADFYSTSYGTSLVVPAAGVLTNDSDPRSRPLTAIINGGPSNGTLTLNPNGNFTYTPAAGYSGNDSFTYRANNGTVSSNLATVRISVNPLVFTGLVNGSFEAGFTGWTYTGNQHIQSTAPYVPTNGTKLVGYNGADLTPNAVMSQSFLTMPGQTYTLAFDLGVLSYNTSSQTMQVTVDGTGNLLTRMITINGLGGGTCRWLPQSFTFVANSTSATLTFRDQSLSTLNIDMMLDNARVTGPPVLANTAPAAASDSYSTYQDTPLLIPPSGVLANDTDAQSQALTAYLNTIPAHGTVILETTGGFIYTPYQGFSGNDSFTYAANDGALGSNTTTVFLTIIEINTAPVAMTDSYATSENTALVVPSGGVLANDTDAQSQTLSAYLDVGPGHGTLSLNPNGSFVYTPAAGYFGSDSFTYHANDGALNSNIITVALTINEVVPPPIATADSYSTDENAALVIPGVGVLFNDSDPRSRPLIAVLDAGPSHGTLSLNANGGFTYTPNAGYFGNDSFTYHARNGFLNSAVAAVDITIHEIIPPNLNPLSLTGSPGNINILLIAQQAGSYILERSEDLTLWQYVTEKQISGPGPVQFNDQSAPQDTKRKMFYRVGLRPTAN